MSFNRLFTAACRATGSMRNEAILKSRNTSLPLWMQVCHLRTSSSTIYGQPVLQQEIIEDTAKEENDISKSVIAKVNNQIAAGTHGRLFAVAFLAGRQKLITPEDLIIVDGTFPPNIGDRIRLEKVMCVGGCDFTLLGRPLLSKDLVNVEATVIEKTLSHSKVHFYSWRRHNSRRTKFHRETYTLLRINSIELKHKINEFQEIEGVDGRMF